MEQKKSVGYEYKGNQIFRHQPHHSYFDKPFDDKDCLFQALHEIDPYFLKEEHKAETINIINSVLRDPRTKNPINKICYDHTKPDEFAIFVSPKKSFIKAEDHESGVRVLNLIQQRLAVEEEDMYNWYRIQTQRLREKGFFQKFLFEYCQNNNEILYAPCRKLLKLYQKWYNSKSARLLRRYHQETYNTYLGLPQVKQCKNILIDQHVHISNPEIVIKVGEQCKWNENIKNELKLLNHNIESYVGVFANSEDLEESLADDLKQQFEKMTKQTLPESPCLYMPLESILFLVTAGDYVDLPTEMLLNINEIESRKYIVMDLPLPSRQGGWHTYGKVLEQAVLAMISINQVKYMDHDIAETNASIKTTKSFQAATLKDFMESCKLEPDKLCRFAKNLIKWQLSSAEDEMNFQIYTSLDCPADKKSIAVKLEYKPKFGCEVLTKYETLKEWFKLKLLSTTENSCLRLDVTNFQVLLHEALHIDKLEDILSSMYQLKCHELLNNIFEFLKMLYGMPLGHYMLRYNPKFKDKILLCKPSQEITQNTVHLHQLINQDVTDIEFISQQNFLPIDENLCNIMHLQHRTLPAAFSPYVKDKTSNTKTRSKQKINLPQPINHPSKKQSKSFKVSPTNTKTKKPVNRSKKKRANRTRRQYEAQKAKCNELNEINEEMELDRLMLNNI